MEQNVFLVQGKNGSGLRPMSRNRRPGILENMIMNNLVNPNGELAYCGSDGSKLETSVWPQRARCRELDALVVDLNLGVLLYCE